jgi:hypothetical protein
MIISFEIKLIIIDDTVYLNYKDRNEILVSGPIVYIKRKRDIASYKRINSEHSRMSSGQTSLEQMLGVYKWVVDDVIKNVREDFLNEGVDTQILEDLKQVS